MEEQGKQQEIEIEEVTAQENVIAVRDLVPIRAAMSVDDLLEQFALRAGKALDNDRILFSKVETQE